MHQKLRYMKTIELEEAIELISEATAVVVENHVVFPSILELMDDEDNVFLELSWENDDGLIWNLKFIEGDNKTIQISGSKMYLRDTASSDIDDTIELELLVPMELE